jgi:hypothetical protein
VIFDRGRLKAACDAFLGNARSPFPLILRSRVSGVSKDAANIGASWFETRKTALLTMRGAIIPQ